MRHLQAAIRSYQREPTRLLAVAAQDWPEWHPFLLTLARSGIRLGEAVGLEWRDVDFERRVLIIRHTERRGRVSVPKSGKSRRVDMSRQLTHALSGLKSLQEAEAAVAGLAAPARVFTEQLGHHSPAFTLAVYGHLIPRGDRRAVDRLDDAPTRNPGATESAELGSLSYESEQIQPTVSELAL